MLEDADRPPRPRPRSDAFEPVPDALRPRSVSSRQLLAGARELCIEHCGELYRLRVTRQNKLILTK